MKSVRKTLTNNLECLTNYAQLLLNEECKYHAKQRQEVINRGGSFCILLSILFSENERKYAELPVGGVPAFANKCTQLTHWLPVGQILYWSTLESLWSWRYTSVRTLIWLISCHPFKHALQTCLQNWTELSLPPPIPDFRLWCLLINPGYDSTGVTHHFITSTCKAVYCTEEEFIWSEWIQSRNK